MMELTIMGQIYCFNFGMGFLKEINAKVQTVVQGTKGVTRNIGLRYAVSSIIDGDVEALVDVLLTANKGQQPRLLASTLEAYIDNPATNIDELFDMVLDFLKKSNSCRRMTNEILEAVEAQKAQKENQD